MLLSATIGEINPDGTTSSIVTRVLIWERTPTELVKRAEVFEKNPGVFVGMPFAFVDLEGDGELDVVSFDLGAPVGYVNDGALVFNRKLLSPRDAASAGRIAIALSVADRNKDGVNDLLVVLVETGRNCG